MNRILLTVLALSLASCASRAPDLIFSPQGASGALVGTITFDSSAGEYELIIATMSGMQIASVSAGASTWVLPIASTDTSLRAKGGTFARDILPGDYQVISWRVHQGPKDSQSTKRLSVPFRVEAGKITYLGNFHFDSDWNLSLRDMSTRDIPTIKNRFPVLADAPLAFAIAPGTSIDGLGGEYSSSFRQPIVIPVVVR